MNNNRLNGCPGPKTSENSRPTSSQRITMCCELVYLLFLVNVPLRIGTRVGTFEWLKGQEVIFSQYRWKLSFHQF